MRITLEVEPELAAEIARALSNHAEYMRSYRSNGVAITALYAAADEIERQVHRKPVASESGSVQENRKRG